MTLLDSQTFMEEGKPQSNLNAVIYTLNMPKKNKIYTVLFHSALILISISSYLMIEQLNKERLIYSAELIISKNEKKYKKESIKKYRYEDIFEKLVYCNIRILNYNKYTVMGENANLYLVNENTLKVSFQVPNDKNGNKCIAEINEAIKLNIKNGNIKNINNETIKRIEKLNYLYILFLSILFWLTLYVIYKILYKDFFIALRKL